MWGKPANTNVDADEQNSKSSEQMSCFQFLTEGAEWGRDLCRVFSVYVKLAKVKGQTEVTSICRPVYELHFKICSY